MNHTAKPTNDMEHIDSLDFLRGITISEILFILLTGSNNKLRSDKNAPPAARNATGLFHTAILYPTRKDLATIQQRPQEANYPLTGASDHGVSKALYLETGWVGRDVYQCFGFGGFIEGDAISPI